MRRYEVDTATESCESRQSRIGTTKAQQRRQERQRSRGSCTVQTMLDWNESRDSNKRGQKQISSRWRTVN